MGNETSKGGGTIKDKFEGWRDKMEYNKIIKKREKEKKKGRSGEKAAKGRFSIDIDPELAAQLSNSIVHPIERETDSEKEEDPEVRASTSEKGKKRPGRKGKKSSYKETGDGGKGGESEKPGQSETAQAFNRILERGKRKIESLLHYHPELEKACTSLDVIRYIADADEEKLGVLSPEIYMELRSVLYHRFDMPYMRPGNRYKNDFEKDISMKEQLIDEQKKEIQKIEDRIKSIDEDHAHKDVNAAEKAIKKEEEIEYKRIKKMIEAELDSISAKEKEIAEMRKELIAVEDRLIEENRQLKQKLVAVEMELNQEKEAELTRAEEERKRQKIRQIQEKEEDDFAEKLLASPDAGGIGQLGVGSSNVPIAQRRGEGGDWRVHIASPGSEGWDDYTGWGTVSPTVSKLREIEKRRREQREQASTDGQKRWVGAIQDVILLNQVGKGVANEGGRGEKGIDKRESNVSSESGARNSSLARNSRPSALDGNNPAIPPRLGKVIEPQKERARSTLNFLFFHPLFLLITKGDLTGPSRPSAGRHVVAAQNLYKMGAQITEEIVKVSRADTRPSPLRKQGTYTALLSRGGSGVPSTSILPARSNAAASRSLLPKWMSTNSLNK
mmetsp:Transcript_45074/g.116549  ORF Transcript_45074/g.116549 Transcript_45074/m.116549 type:complete len:614 (-) Transcript_45074:211-2052(-)